jgi:hypothetical protein
VRRAELAAKRTLSSRSMSAPIRGSDHIAVVYPAASEADFRGYGWPME